MLYGFRTDTLDWEYDKRSLCINSITAPMKRMQKTIADHAAKCFAFLRFSKVITPAPTNRPANVDLLDAAIKRMEMQNISKIKAKRCFLDMPIRKTEARTTQKLVSK